MASFNINFTANTTGNHYVGYRTYNDTVNTYTVIALNVTSIGAHTVVINVPGNLYCADYDIEYTGYVIAGCEVADEDALASGIPAAADDLNGDGIPDVATTWIVTLIKQDESGAFGSNCEFVELECKAVPITSLSYTGGSNSCFVGTHPLVFPGGNEVLAATGELTIDVATLAVTSLTLLTAGAYSAVIAPGDITCPAAGGCDNLQISAVMGLCPPLIIGDYTCGSVVNSDPSTLSDYNEFELGDTYNMCTDIPSQASIPNYLGGGGQPGFLLNDIGSCHCENCYSLDIDATAASSGTGKISYQTCWDRTGSGGTFVAMYTIPLTPTSSFNTGCIIENSIIYEGDLDVSPTFTPSSC
jgi:hypothetical protein